MVANDGSQRIPARNFSGRMLLLRVNEQIWVVLYIFIILVLANIECARLNFLFLFCEIVYLYALT
jgi:hypothetical protein